MAIKGLRGFQWVYKGHKDPLSGNTATTRYAVNQLTGDRLNVRQVATKQHEGISYERFIQKHNIEPKQYKPRSGAVPKVTKPKGPLAGVAHRIINRVKRPKYPLSQEQKKDRATYTKRYNKAADKWFKNYDAEHGTNYRDTLDVPQDVLDEFHKDYDTVKHPDRYDDDEFSDAWDWISDYEDVDDYDSGDWGDTP
jgi:hypothetical protein